MLPMGTNGCCGSRLCKNRRPVFAGHFGVDCAFGLRSGRSQAAATPFSRSARCFVVRPQNPPLMLQIPRISGAGHNLPHVRIACISGTTPSTFITRFRL
jgi:hypothetical protein